MVTRKKYKGMFLTIPIRIRIKVKTGVRRKVLSNKFNIVKLAARIVTTIFFG